MYRLIVVDNCLMGYYDCSLGIRGCLCPSRRDLRWGAEDRRIRCWSFLGCLARIGMVWVCDLIRDMLR